MSRSGKYDWRGLAARQRLKFGVRKVAYAEPVDSHSLANKPRATMWEGKQTVGEKVPGHANKASNI